MTLVSFPLQYRSPPVAASQPWSILRVTPNMERKVRDALSEQGLTVYCPVERYKPANHWRPRTRPLMPGYLFAQLPDDEAIDTARGNYAVREIMCREGVPVQLEAAEVGAIILFEACHAFDQTWRPPLAKRNKRRGRRPTVHESRWVHGQKVKVVEGPFSGFVGEVMRTDRGSRIDVLLAVFGRATPVEIGEDEVEAAKGEAA